MIYIYISYCKKKRSKVYDVFQFMESICLSVTTNQHATFTVNISTLLAIHSKFW